MFQHGNAAGCLVALLFAPGLCRSQEDQVAHFGTTVVTSSGLRGDIYFIPPGSLKLPRFEKLQPVGSIYTSQLNVPVHDFTRGFPGVTDRFEWFAIDYHGKFWIEHSGKYTFALVSDDGSKLYIDGHEIIDNDGQHSARGIAAVHRLKTGEHSLRLSYFQGPRTQVALILAVIRPGEDDFILFNMDDYLSPQAQAEWKKSKPDAHETPEEFRLKRKPGQDFVMAPTIPRHP